VAERLRSGLEIHLSWFDSGSQLLGNLMDIRTQKTFEALFALEDVREILLQKLPNATSPEDEHSIKEGIDKIREILDDLKNSTGTPQIQKIADSIDIRSR
jgi:Sep-tRNA:Cys-tRNA synthetase